MNMAHDFLLNLALALGVAGLAAAVFQRLRQPAVLGYLVAGILVGPHVPVPLFADAEIVGALSELGVILLMFSIGLEFPLRTVPKVAGAGGLVALIEVGALAWLGGLVGLAFGWSPAERLFAGAMVAISSTSLIARLFEDRGETGPHRDLVFGVLIVEDLIAILLLTVLATLGTGGELHLGSAGLRLGGIVLGLMVGGLIVVPRVVRALDRSGSDEVLSVGAIGVCFGMALLAAQLGASVALGAFLAGTLAAESGLGHKLQGLLRGVRDVFGALFFVSVGMLFDPALVWEHAPAVLALFAVVIVGKVVGVSAGAFLVGSGMRDSVRAGFSMRRDVSLPAARGRRGLGAHRLRLPSPGPAGGSGGGGAGSRPSSPAPDAERAVHRLGRAASHLGLSELSGPQAEAAGRVRPAGRCGICWPCRH